MNRQDIRMLARLSVAAEQALLMILSASINRALLALAHNNQSEFSSRMSESLNFCRIAKSSGTPVARAFATKALPILQKFA